MKTTSLYIASALFALLFICSCGNNRPKINSIDPGFSEYISAYSSGIIKRDESIRIELAMPVEKLTSMDSTQLSKLFESEPAIKGKVIAISDRIIEFVPSEPMDVNQFYTVTFNLEKVATVPSNYEEFTFQFATKRQEIEVSDDGIQNYNTYQIENQYLNGRISTSEVEDTVKLRNTLSAKLNGKALKIRWKETYYNEHYFVIDSIKRTNKPQKLILQWNGSSIQSLDAGSKEFDIAALGDFTVTSKTVSEDDDQKIDLVFSDPLDMSQNLDGIITIKGIDKLTYSINRNTVSVYLPNRREGTFPIHISTGIKNCAGYKMDKEYKDEIFLHEAYPKVKLIGNGTILPNSQGLIFPFEAIALKSVSVRVIKIYEKNVHYFLQVNDLNGEDELTRFGKIIAEKKIQLKKDLNLKQWNTHVLKLESLITPEPGAIYQIAIKFEKDDITCDCPETDEDQESEYYDEEVSDDEWNEYNWHSYGFDGYSTWGYSSEEGPCSNSYYYGSAVRTNILASNIGMIFKLDEDKTSHAFVSDMVTTAPIANATVTYYDYVKNIIATATTNSEGMATVKLNQKPFLMIASKNNQKGYLKLTDGLVNSLSKFDVSGEVIQKGVKGFIYAERSVWRPGDSLYVNFILQDELKTLPENHPVKFELFDPSGNVIYQHSTNKHVNGVYDFRTATNHSAPTGNYRGEVSIGNKQYTKYFKVETIKPNRLKILMDVNKGPTKDSCYLQANWLHGASAKDLDATVSMYLAPMQTKIKGFESYHFDSPIRTASSERKLIFDGKLNSKGNAAFKSSHQNMTEAAGMMQANFVTKVFEKSGNFSIDRKVASFSPFNAYVGLKSPQTSKYDNTLETDKKHVFELVNVDVNGKAISGHKVKIQIFKIDWNWWYDSDESDLSNFIGRSSTVLVKEQEITVQNGKAQFNFDVKYPDYGSYIVVATDQVSKHQTGQMIRIDWPYWNRTNRSENEFASMLSFSLDKQSYTKGEAIKITFPSPSAGRALISIETSQKVIKKFWITTNEGETTHSFEATADMAPNAFIHVTMIQPHHATKNDLPIRMFGVMPVMVDDPNTHLHPIISMNNEIRPESTTSITVKEEHGRKMTYTLAIVDDGLLDITAFKTPQPWDVFYAKEALGVQTWDMYNDVIGAYSGKMDNLYTIGGDAASIVGNGPKANRFKPMVIHLGPFSLNAGQSKTHKIEIPSYLGSVRVMVVARDNDAYGNAQKTVLVKKPVMLLATLPRVLGPQEEFLLPVDVFAMEKSIKNVNLKIEVNELFELVDSPSKSVQFTEVGDQIVNYKIRVKNKIGIGKIKITGSSGKENATEEIEVDIRPANTFNYDVQEFQIEPGKSISSILEMNGLEGTNLGTIELSTIPAIHLEKRMGYLIHYPHGCVEQTTSAVFPQLFLSQLSQLSAKEEQSVTSNVKAGLQRLQLFQTAAGGFGYWPGETQENEWGTNYAGHFMLESEALGYKIPMKMKERWLSYQKQAARNWSQFYSANTDQYNSSQLTQAYRLYLLAMANQPEIGSMNRLREEKQLSTTAKWRLASAYYLIGQKDAASKLTQSATSDIQKYKELSGSFGSDLRDRAVILESMSCMKMNSQAFNSMKIVAKELSSDRWMSTQETGYSLLAMAKFVNSYNGASTTQAEITLNQEGVKSMPVNKRIIKQFVVAKDGMKKQTAFIKNSGTGVLFATVTTQKIPLAGNEKSFKNKLDMSVTYTDFTGKTITVDQLKQGQEFIAKVTVRNTSKNEHYTEMALSQLFPSGWEVHNARLFGGDIQGIASSDRPRYQDIRDDRVLSYFSLAPGKSMTIAIQLNATFRGKFYLPAVYSEAMYDHSISAQVAGKWVNVVQ